MSAGGEVCWECGNQEAADGYPVCLDCLEGGALDYPDG